MRDITGKNPKYPSYNADGSWFDLIIGMTRPFMFRAYPVFVVVAMVLISAVQVRCAHTMSLLKSCYMHPYIHFT